MPQKTYKKKTKKTYKRKAKYTKPKNTGFPMSMTTTLRYVDVKNINPSTGLGANQVFRANGIFDPDYTGTGHQPRGFDQLMTVYNNWIVLGSKATYRLSSLDTNTNDCAVIATCADSPNTSNDLINILEQKQGKAKIFQINGSNNVSVSSYFSTKRWNQGSNPITNEDLIGTSSADPTRTFYHNFQVCNMNSSTDVGTVDVLCDLEFRVKFFNPRELGQS